MNSFKLAGLLLIVAGILALVYGSFTYPRNHEAKLGPLAVSVQEAKTVYIPIWADAGGIALGVLLLLVGSRKL